MTASEQANLDTLRAEVQAGFAEMRAMMETRRLEERAIQDSLVGRLAVVESQLASSSAIARFGKWAVATLCAMAALAMTYLNR